MILFPCPSYFTDLTRTQKYKELDKIDTKERDANEEAKAFVMATNKSMRIATGADAITVFSHIHILKAL